MTDPIVKEGMLYKQSEILKNWNQRYFVVTTKYLVYYHHPNVEPRRRELLDNLTLEWPGEYKGKFYTMRIRYKGKSKLAMLIGCKDPDEGLEWANAISKTKSADTPEEGNGENRARYMSARMTRVSMKYNQTNIPKFMQVGYNLITSTDSWRLIGDMTYEKDQWMKNVIQIPAPIEAVAEALQLKRMEWDWTFGEYRVISSVEPFKFIKVSIGKKSAVVMSGIVPDLPFAIYISNETVAHAYYPSNVSFAEYYCIRQHPYNTSSSLITRVTTLTDILPSITGLKSYLEVQDFRASAADVPLGQMLEESDLLEESPMTFNEQVSFNEYFVYGEGGNYERDVVNGGLVLKDKDLISKQKSVVTHLLRNAGKNLIKGKGIMNVSLPVNIFETQSLLQRLLNSFGYAPIYLEAAGRESGLERFKYVVTFAICMLHLSTDQRKPFNPILGETVQGFLGDVEVYAEQTCHHPPISHHYSIGKYFKMRGYHEFLANTSANSVKARQKNASEVMFEDSSVFISMPTCVITGLMIGKRVFNWAGVMTIMDPHNGLFLEIIFNPEKKGAISGMFSKATTTIDYFKGTILKVAKTHPMMNPEVRNAICNDGKNPLEYNREDVEEQLGVVEGTWPVELKIDGVNYWKFTDTRPYRLRPANDLLPSDSSVRQDLITLIRGDEQSAQEKKDILENQQRNDRRLRKA